MRPGPKENDPFDLGFDADDEFAPAPAVGWGAPSSASATAGRAGAIDLEDPFADFPPARPSEARAAAPAREAPVQEPDAFAPDAFGAEAFPDDAFSDLDEAPFNPVGDMIAGAQSAMAEPAPAAPYAPAFGASGGEAGVPRIAIHAFCAQPQTAALIEQAAADRRMSRATTMVRMGGLAGAVELYQNQPTPTLILVESLDPAPELLAHLDALAEVCDPGTKVVVVGAANDIALYRELMRRGVSEYIAPPLHGPLQIINAVSGLYADPSAPFVGRQIAFVGAKGGVGSSTVAHNFAYSISERLQAGTVIVDYDLAFGTAGLDFNQDPLQGVADALSQPDRLDPVLMDRMMARCTDRLSLFAAPANLESDYDLSTEAYEEVSQKIRGAAPYVVLDLPHAWSGWKRRLLLASDDVVIVATPDLASLRNAKNMIDLVRQARPNDQPPRLVLNMCGVPQRPELPIKDFGDALGIIPSLVLPFDPKLFGNAANNGQMLAEVNAKSKAAEGIDHLAQLISRRDPPPATKSSLLGSLFRKK